MGRGKGREEQMRKRKKKGKIIEGERERERESQHPLSFPAISPRVSKTTFERTSLQPLLSFPPRDFPPRFVLVSLPERATHGSPLFFSSCLPFGRSLRVRARQPRALPHRNTCVQLLIFVFFHRARTEIFKAATSLRRDGHARIARRMEEQWEG